MMLVQTSTMQWKHKVSKTVYCYNYVCSSPIRVLKLYLHGSNVQLNIADDSFPQARQKAKVIPIWKPC